MITDETLGGLIKQIDNILADVPKPLHRTYAKAFKDTLLETVIFEGESFEQASCTYCRELGWRDLE